jgi:hypothetical protein
VFVVAIPVAMMIFWQMMIGAKTMPTQPALVRKFMEYFSAIMATAHWMRIGRLLRNRLRYNQFD